MDNGKQIPGACIFVAFLTVAASTGIGLVLGGLTPLLYFMSFGVEFTSKVGWQSGIVLGCLVGLAYVAILGMSARRGKRGAGLVGFGIAAGIAAGVAAAIGVHVPVMIAAGVGGPTPLAIGVLFGIGGGAILGAISSGLMACCFKGGECNCIRAAGCEQGIGCDSHETQS